MGTLVRRVGFLRVALALRPGNVGVYVNLGAALKVKGDLDGAIHWAHQALRVDPGWAGQAQVWLTLALAHRDRGDVKEARRWRDRAERWYAEQARADAKRGFADAPPGVPWWEWATVQLLRRELRP